MKNNEPIISLKKVAVSYRRRSGLLRWSKFWALKDISFDIFHGETLGIIGGNGAGKSTLLSILAGIIAPDRGSIVCNGASVSLLSLQVGFIPHLSGRENAVLSGMMLGLHRKDVEQAMGDIVEFSGLGEFIDEPVRTYSTGMKARLGFSVSIQLNPDVILVDEVLGVGDVDFRKKSTSAMKAKIKSNKTVVIVSHDQSTLRELCDRVIWVDRGVSRDKDGNIERLFASYNASF